MKTHRILGIEDPLFAQVWALYLRSFPLIEQRTIEHQKTAMSSPEYHLNCYLDDGTLIGFIGMWLFDGYSYIEHFAVDTSLRNGGWGSKILTLFKSSVGRTIILEIDDLIDDISRRREQFYIRLGFVYNPYYHPLPIYQLDSHEEAMLRIMSYPEAIDQDRYDEFRDDLYRVVMRR